MGLCWFRMILLGRFIGSAIRNSGCAAELSSKSKDLTQRAERKDGEDRERKRGSSLRSECRREDNAEGKNKDKNKGAQLKLAATNSTATAFCFKLRRIPGIRRRRGGGRRRFRLLWRRPRRR